VIESLIVKVTMFTPGNKPARATVNLKLREAQRLSAKKAGT
jgi:hypothetical protein